jgi:hypothetical protein
MSLEWKTGKLGDFVTTTSNRKQTGLKYRHDLLKNRVLKAQT